MDPERVDDRPQSESTPPVHEERIETIPVRLDPFHTSSPTAPHMSARIDTPSAGNGNVLSSTNSEVSETSPLYRPHIVNDYLPQHILQAPLPPLPPPVQRATLNSRRDTRITNNRFSGSNVDWIVPTSEEKTKRRTVGDRLEPTRKIAVIERDKAALKAKWTGIAFNAAIGMQVLLGSLTTGLSALAVSGTSAHTAQATTALGALATLVATYLARARGTNEPEISIALNKDLENFIRECEAFQIDHEHVIGDEFDDQINQFRRRFEQIMGNNNNRERKPSEPSAV